MLRGSEHSHAKRESTFGSIVRQILESSLNVCFWILVPFSEVTKAAGWVSWQFET